MSAIDSRTKGDIPIGAPSLEDIRAALSVTPQRPGGPGDGGGAVGTQTHWYATVTPSPWRRFGCIICSLVSRLVDVVIGRIEAVHPEVRHPEERV